jgi:hypothetical protein
MVQKKDLIPSLRAIAKEYKSRLIVSKRVPKSIDGYFLHSTSALVVKSSLTKKDTLITFFHELAHGVAYKHGFWRKYHEGRWGTVDNAYNIEKAIDKAALVLWNRHIEEIPGGRALWKNYEKTYTENDRKRIKMILEEHWDDENAKDVISPEQIKGDLARLLEILK